MKLETVSLLKNQDGQMTTIEYDEYPINEQLCHFFQRFGGLTVTHPHYRSSGAVDYFMIDPIVGIRGTFKETVEEYENRIGEHLTLVGLAFRGHMVLLISNTVSMFAGFDESNKGSDFKKLVNEFIAKQCLDEWVW